MLAFKTAFLCVLVALMYMCPGYILGKAKKASAEHLSTMSAVLIYVLSPCMIVSSFFSMEFSTEALRDMGVFFLVSFAVEVAFLLSLFLILRKKFHINKYRMLAIGSALGNCGFFGMPLIQALLPDHPEVACYSSIYVISMNILVFTAAVYCLTLDKKYISLHSAIINPAVLSLLAGLVLYIVGAPDHIPGTIKDAIVLLGKMTTPVCMLILGIRLSTIKFKELFSEPFVYLIWKTNSVSAYFVRNRFLPSSSVCFQSEPFHSRRCTLRIGHSEYGGDPWQRTEDECELHPAFHASLYFYDPCDVHASDFFVKAPALLVLLPIHSAAILSGSVFLASGLVLFFYTV